MFGDTVKVRGLRSVILEADRVLHAGEVASVKPLQAAILRECNGAELVDPDDLPKLHAAVDKENRRVLRLERQHPRYGDDDPRWVPRY